MSIRLSTGSPTTRQIATQVANLSLPQIEPPEDISLHIILITTIPIALRDNNPDKKMNRKERWRKRPGEQLRKPKRKRTMLKKCASN